MSDSILEIGILIGFHIFLLTVAALIAFRPSLKRVIVLFTLGAFIFGQFYLWFNSFYAKINPSDSGKLRNHIYAIIPYIILTIIINELDKKRRSRQGGQKK